MGSTGYFEQTAPPVQSTPYKMHYRISDNERRYTIQVRLARETQEVTISHIEVPSYFPGSKVEIILANMGYDSNPSVECRQVFTIPSAYSTKTFEVQREYKLVSVHFPVAIISPKRRKASAISDPADIVSSEGPASAAKRSRRSTSALTTPPPPDTDSVKRKSIDSTKVVEGHKNLSPVSKKQKNTRLAPGSVILTNPDMTKENYPQLHRDIPAHRDVKFMPQLMRRKEY